MVTNIQEYPKRMRIRYTWSAVSYAAALEMGTPGDKKDKKAKSKVRCTAIVCVHVAAMYIGSSVLRGHSAQRLLGACS